MAALQDIQAAQATKAYPEHLHYKLSLRWKALVVLNLKGQHLTNQGGILFERTRKGGGGKREDDKDKKAARLVFFFPLKNNFCPPSSSFFNFQVKSICSDSEQKVRADWNQKKQKKWQH